ncbi:MAG: single-stranded DNA-binding protein [Deltaproteobacteria bacterium]|nr:single-stranded DNA-binding protein [Deltaproteobacteria bacterium]
MNKVFLIGNLTRDPELRTSPSGIPVCSFNLAVNRRTSADHPEADYFRVTAWRGLAETCRKYLAKGRKVCVIGEVRATAYISSDGEARASLEVTAQDVEFLTPKKQEQPQEETGAVPPGFTRVDDDEDLPY